MQKSKNKRDSDFKRQHKTTKRNRNRKGSNICNNKNEKVTYNENENLKIVENLQDLFYTVPMKRHGQR